MNGREVHGARGGVLLRNMFWLACSEECNADEAFAKAIEKLKDNTPTALVRDKLHGRGRHAVVAEAVPPLGDLVCIRCADWMAAARLILPRFVDALCGVFSCEYVLL